MSGIAKQAFVSGGAIARMGGKKQTVALFGSSGQLGRYITNSLGRAGVQVNYAHRCGEHDVKHLRIMGELGQLVAFPIDPRDDESMEKALRGVDTVIFAIGKEYPTVNYTLEDVNVVLPGTVARLAKKAGVEKFVHVSALGAKWDSESEFYRTKALGEEIVKKQFPTATIVRPAHMYGPEDHYLNTYAPRNSVPFVFPILNPERKMAPVSAIDAGEAVAKCATKDWVAGKTVELSGKVRTEQEIAELVQKLTMKDESHIMKVPEKIQEIGAKIGQNLPQRYTFLHSDSVAASKVDAIPSGEEGVITFEDLEVSTMEPQMEMERTLRIYRRPADLLKNVTGGSL